MIFNIVLVLLYISITEQFSIRKLRVTDSEIRITIKGNGTQYILNNNSYMYLGKYLKFKDLPSEILINGNKINKIDYIITNLTGIENNITMKWNKSLTNCNVMFYNLRNIIQIDLSDFDSSHVISMISMFRDCKSLKILKLGNFNTSSINDMENLFYGCNSLISLDLSNFDTKLVTNMKNMFYECKSLTSLNISSFDTSSVSNMYSMFYDCNSLIYLNLSNFDTSKVSNMMNMFNGCTSLISLDLKNFNISNVYDMKYMFNSCSSLISLDLRNFNISPETYNNYMFKNCNNDLIYCIKDESNILLDIIKSQLKNSINNCSDICFIESKKIILEMKKCVLNCLENAPYIFEYNKICYKLCPNGTYNSLNNTYLCEENDSILDNYFNSYSSFPIISSYYSDNSNSNFLNSEIITNYISDIPSSEILNITEYSSINKNIDLGTSILSNSTLTHIDYIIDSSIINISDNFNSDFKFSDIVYDSSTIIISDINSNFIIRDNLTSDSQNSTDILDNYNNFLEKILKENNNNSKDNILINIRNELVNGNLDSIISNTIIKEKKDLVFKENNIVYQITSSNNENNKNNNISTIKLGECEEKLRQENNINDNITLLILKIEIYEEGLLIPIIEYEVYNSETKEKLDLNICKDLKIQINNSVSIDENNLFKYNSSHEYYNDICYVYTTNSKTDIILEDRRNEYINNNLSLCEKNCEYSYYDSINKNSVCDCIIKVKFPLISEIEINEDMLINNFINIKQPMNINVMKCYEILFNKEGLKNNIGNYIMSFNIINLIVLTIVFKIKGYNKLKAKINQIINIKKENENNKIVGVKKNKNKIRSNILNITC